MDVPRVCEWLRRGKLGHLPRRERKDSHNIRAWIIVGTILVVEIGVWLDARAGWDVFIDSVLLVRVRAASCKASVQPA